MSSTKRYPTRPVLTRLLLLTLLLLTAFLGSCVTQPPPQTGPLLAVENLPGSSNFEPLDFSVVGTANPTVRVRSDLPSDFRLFNTRLDGRAGVDGNRREITRARYSFQATSQGTVVSFDVLVGQNTIIVTDNTGADTLAVATMLNYSLDFEDVNGNGQLDTGEDTNANGVLDAGEDANGNELLDFNEDLNGNGRLDVNEDLDGDGVLDPGEDLDGNGAIDPIPQVTSAPIPSAPGDLRSIAATRTAYNTRVLLLDFVETATDVEISSYLRQQGNRPLGLDFAGPRIGAKTITASVPTAEDALRMVQRLNGLPETGVIFFPDVASIPVATPLSVARLLTYNAPPDTAGETLPARLRNGAAAPPSPGNAGDNYNAATGGFDNDDDGGGNDFDELNISYHHFFMDTFAAHRLVDVLMDGVANPTRPVVALIDTGLGDGSGNALVDFQAARVVQPTNCTTAAVNCNVVALRQIPDAWRINSVPPEQGDHGTGVAHLAGGAGQRILGIGKDIAIRPFKAAGSMVRSFYARAMRIAARDPAVRIIVLEYQEGADDLNGNGTIDNVAVNTPAGPVNEIASAVSMINNVRGSWLPGINAVITANPNKIVVIPAGNASQSTNFSLLTGPQATAQGQILGLFNAPVPGTRAAGQTNALIMDISNATVAAPPLGQQRLGESTFGNRISVAALSDGVPSLSPNQAFQPFGGSSGAAPQVAGLAGELIFLDDNLANVGPFTPLQIVELIEGTADDLGSTRNTPPFPNDNPGNGPDNPFGHGRINVWKAVLSAVNGGLATESARAGAFPSLTRITAANTRWYGVRVITSVRGATAWIDERQLVDANAAVPGIPAITAYKGVRSDQVIRNGVRGEDPTSGVVPVGNNGGEYVLTFSIECDDLLRGNTPRTLGLRRPGEGLDKAPFYNLKLDL